MNMPGCNVWVIVGVLVMAGSVGCKPENPAEQAKVPAASGNAVTEAVGQAAVDAVNVPLDKARQTEGVLEKSVEQTAAEINKGTR
ncbi:MAG: hypothetical protein HP491_03750 [Nitrospira sp.]|nr:hypothetical protein [Nitrospira sp.]MBH0180947.1 hypothetical protein [Nitrospira sp.]MBH0185563.1 hypothetical protein [Nitrospira sp.]